MTELEKMKEHNKEIKEKLEKLLGRKLISPQEEQEIMKIEQELNYQKLNKLINSKKR